MGDGIRIFISTGEVSGDLQGSLLIAALQRQAVQRGLALTVDALGGDRMAAAGAQLLANTSAIGSIGILESLPYVWSSWQIQQRVKRYFQQYPPDLVVMIDYFGPNVGLGRFIRQALPQVPTVYYIAPQEWVWSISPRNTEQILAISDRLLAIFQGEAAYYRRFEQQLSNQQTPADRSKVSWVGHPLVDRVREAPNREHARQSLGIPSEQMAIALIPASRRQEIRYILPIMFAGAQRIQAQIPQVHFWIPVALESYRAALAQGIATYQLNASLTPAHQPNPAQTVIAAADLAITKSGTVNLEIALQQVPQVVMYRVHPATAWIAKHLLKFSIPFAAPPNLVLMEPIVPEFIQDAASPERIAQEAVDILGQPARRQQMLDDYGRMRQQLGELGVCDRAAQEIFSLLPLD